MSGGLGTTKHPTNSRAPQRSNAVRGWYLPIRGGVHSTRASLLPPAASGSFPAAVSPLADSASQATSIPPIPPAVQSSLSAARRSWVDRCLNAPLVDPVTNSRVHVYGNVHFAPLGGPDGLAELLDLLDHVQPTVLAIEQPYDMGARAGLPYPDVIHHLTGLFPDGATQLAAPLAIPELANNESGSGSGFQQSGFGAASSSSGLQEQVVERLRSLLPGLAQPARVGRDLLDPFEVYGLYGGCDYVVQPGQLVEALSLFGHLPGLEYAALAVAAQQRGVQVCSVDAPLRLQEKWAAQLVEGFSLQEADLARSLQADLARAQALLPPEYLAWDVALAEALRRRLERERERERAESGNGGGGGGGGGHGESPLSTMTAFKVSRAVAAATVPYEVSREAFALQAALQPLKFAFFGRRARHLVLQVRDLCQRMSIRQVRMDAERFRSTPAASAGQVGQRELGRTEPNGNGRGPGAAPGRVAALVDASEQPEKVVLAVVGRQYMPYIEELWANERSVLWHGDVPRTFAPSTLER
ncbi:hypothetical protein PLESTB_001158600 [Pleodorina starrii]|uniref:Uncharacterized protein n=1 Tax=Pleodorina starrii TaxID=330485 RepID=A0A9W6BRG1_9CHLO|nr:hypothetical protein PLESTM_000235300 [Pleodorina starrii]GLC56874.1 hypothetical protein PLESTB_001158600 [Pleodorina starrii]GLC64712.1 hypothetical protein PLESTF_000199400 [Pleodorina starrii]